MLCYTVLHCVTLFNRILLNAELTEFVADFTEYQHTSWVFSMQATGWVYDPQYSKEKHHHPNIRPYETLEHQVKGRQQ